MLNSAPQLLIIHSSSKPLRADVGLKSCGGGGGVCRLIPRLVWRCQRAVVLFVCLSSVICCCLEAEQFKVITALWQEELWGVQKFKTSEQWRSYTERVIGYTTGSSGGVPEGTKPDFMRKMSLYSENIQHLSHPVGEFYVHSSFGRAPTVSPIILSMRKMNGTFISSTRAPEQLFIFITSKQSFLSS